MQGPAVLIRYSDWPERLTRFLAGCQSRQFAYGSFDCCLFVADAVLAMTGADIAAEFRGRYRSRREAFTLAENYAGKRSIRALIEKALAQLPEVPVLCAQRGDPMLIRRGSDYSLGLIDLSGQRIVKPAASGFVTFPLTHAVCAWRV